MTASVSALLLRLEILVCVLAAALPAGAVTHLVYSHSGQPAQGLSVVERAPERRARRLVTDELGQVPTLQGGSEVTIRDSRTHIILMRIARGESIPDPIQVPELIRLSGTVQADPDARTGLIVRYGVGKRITAMQRLQRNYDRYSTLKAPENTFFGLDLPTAPAHWLNATVDAAGRFTTKWFPAVDHPMIVAHNAARAIGISDFTLPKSFRTGETFTLDPLSLTPTRSLTIRYNAPPSPIALDAEVFLRDVQVDPQQRESVRRVLSVLDAIDPRLLVFAIGLRPYNIETGETVISGLPQFRGMQVRLKGAFTPDTLDRTVQFQGNQADVAVSAGDLFPRGASTLLKGVVVLEDSYEPVKDAKVVYSCYPEKVETTTNENGEFSIPGACADRDVTFFVTASDSLQPARFPPVQVRKRIQPKRTSQPLVITLPVPPQPGRSPAPHTVVSIGPQERFQAEHERPHLQALEGSPLAGLFRGSAVPPGAYFLQDSQYDEGPIVYVYEDNMEGEIPDNVVKATWEYQFGSKIRLTVSTTGTWHVLLAVSAFMVYTDDAVDLIANQEKEVTLKPLHFVRFGSWLSVVSAYLPRPASNIPVYFASPAIDPDPTEIDTNQLGVARMGLLDTDTIHVFVSDKRAGYFDCDVKLDFRLDANVLLLPTPSTPCPK